MHIRCKRTGGTAVVIIFPSVRPDFCWCLWKAAYRDIYQVQVQLIVHCPKAPPIPERKMRSSCPAIYPWNQEEYLGYTRNLKCTIRIPPCRPFPWWSELYHNCFVGMLRLMQRNIVSWYISGFIPNTWYGAKFRGYRSGATISIPGNLVSAAKFYNRHGTLSRK